MQEDRMAPNAREHQELLDQSEDHRKSSLPTTQEDGSFRLMDEAGRLFQVGLPSVLMRFALYWIFPQAASVVGRSLGA